MKETVRPDRSEMVNYNRNREIVDSDRNVLVQKAKLGMSTLKAATEERQSSRALNSRK